ncbi:MAG: PA14 domain-containing protein [Chloroflexota bacterium]|nr:PA14 domain-containing protein [Chloroflexota bacterium]
MASQDAETGRPGRRWQPFLMLFAIACGAAVIGLLLFGLFQTLRPERQPELRLIPAAGRANEDTWVRIAGDGWSGNEKIAVCLSRPGNPSCTPETALAIEHADRAGTFTTEVKVGQQLKDGQTAFVGLGLDSGLSAVKEFRVLKDPHASAPLPTQANRPAVRDSPATPTAIAVATETPIPAYSGGWQAEYFANTSLSGAPEFVREESELSFNWGANAPDARLPADSFSARWTRQISLPGQRFRFIVQADGGARLYIDDILWIDRWDVPPGGFVSSTDIDLLPGDHKVVLEYFDTDGDAYLILRREVSDGFPDWRAAYYDNMAMVGTPVVVRNDPSIVFDWGSGSPLPGILSEDEFSAEWKRDLHFEPGDYLFSLDADDGARMFFDGQLLLDGWDTEGSQVITATRMLAEGGNHNIAVHYHEMVGQAHMNLSWQAMAEESPPPDPTTTAMPPSEPTSAPTTTPSPSPTLTETPAPTETATVTPTTTPTPDLRVIALDPEEGWAGTVISVTSEGWEPGITVGLALLEPGTDASMAEELEEVTAAVSTEGAIQLAFAFPDSEHWLARPLVQIVLHDPEWLIRGVAIFTLVEPS